MIKTSAVMEFERTKTPSTAYALTKLVQSYGGLWNAIPGLTKSVFEKAKKLEGRYLKAQEHLQKWLRKSTRENAMRLKNFIDASDFMPADYDIPNKIYHDLQMKISEGSVEEDIVKIKSPSGREIILVQ